MRTLIVGTGRSGTKWIVETLNVNGIAAAHQTIRHAHVLGEPFVWPEAVEVIVSFEAVPLLPRLSCRKLLVVRNPDDVIGSWLKQGAFQDNMRSEYVAWAAVLDRWFPAVLKEPTPQDRAAHYWVVWNMHAAMYCRETCRLNEIAVLFDGVQWHPPPVSSYPPADLRDPLRVVVEDVWAGF